MYVCETILENSACNLLYCINLNILTPTKLHHVCSPCPTPVCAGEGYTLSLSVLCIYACMYVCMCMCVRWGVGVNREYRIYRIFRIYRCLGVYGRYILGIYWVYTGYVYGGYILDTGCMVGMEWVHMVLISWVCGGYIVSI